MRQSTAVNLVILGGGLTLFGAATTLMQQNRAAAACQKARAEGLGESDPHCNHAGGGFYTHGVGATAGRSRGSTYSSGGGELFASSERSVLRGGFGSFGRGFGGGS